jgi:N-acetylneuraminic acid mutarotase
MGLWGPLPPTMFRAREVAVTWTDASGNLWLFGGSGLDSAGAQSWLNDLWKYSAGEWTWMGGANVVNQAGTYGTQGTPASGNVPGARIGAVSWTDASGNFWLFGGYGLDSAGALGYLNDLWKYSGGEWTWMSGANVVNQKGTYGTLGTPAPTNVPGGRIGAVSWTDPSGNLWLFGGTGYDSAGALTFLNDLWKYSGGEWTWMSGANVVGQAGTYGTQGMPAPGNVPGAREFAVSWTDASGNFWLFGGNGLDSTGAPGLLNDLWKYEH